MDADVVLITLFCSAILLAVSCVVVYRWSLGRVQDDISGLIGVTGVILAVIFIFSTGAEHINGAGAGLAHSVEIFLRPITVLTSCWVGFMFFGPTGIVIALVLTAPHMFPGSANIGSLYRVGSDAGKGVWGTVTSVASALNPFTWFKKKESAAAPGNPFRDGEGGSRKRKLRR